MGADATMRGSAVPRRGHLGFLSFGYHFLYESSYAGTSL